MNKLPLPFLKMHTDLHKCSTFHCFFFLLEDQFTFSILISSKFACIMAGYTIALVERETR